MSPWETLGVERDVAVAELRRRYAALIKTFRPETHPQDFARIREAYELVLPLARRREAEAAESGDDAAAPMPVPRVDRLPEVDEAPASAPVAAAPPGVETVAIDAPALDEAEPGMPELAGYFRRFVAQAGQFPGPRGDALLPELRALLAERTRATLDACQALEFALVRWFLEADVPALALLFETGRAFDWHHHESRLSAWLPPDALRHMERLLSLSRDAVFARHFSANPWLRALHSARPHRAPIARLAPQREALRWAGRWQQDCEDIGQHALARGLDARALASLQGRELLVTDLLVGAVCASAASSLEGMGLWLVAGTALTFALRRLAWFVRRRPEANRVRRAFARLLASLRVVIVLSVVAGMVGVVQLADSDADLWALLAGGALLVPIGVLAVSILWRLAQVVELYITEGLAWRDAVDRWEFDRFVRGRTAAGASAPYGSRLRWRSRLAAIPKALRLQQAELATRARPALPPRFAGPSALRGRGSVPRLMWFGAWILFAILRLFHVIGAGH